VRDLLETLNLNKNKLKVNPKMDKLVKKQKEDFKSKLEQIEASVDQEMQKVTITEELELVSGKSKMIRLWNLLVQIRALFEKIRNQLNQKFAVKPTQKKEVEDREDDANKSQNDENNNDREDKDKKDKNKKDNSDEMLSKKWDALKMKLDKIKLQFGNLNEAYKKVIDNEKKQ